ncbi:MAG: response regulator [Nitrospirae bacterium]|nr:response regulator [Nitrospirota bacterium]
MTMPKILIVDDEQIIRTLINHTLEPLEDNGVVIITAQDGEEALKIIKKDKPELVFLDIAMPEMDGFEVCDTVKNKLHMKGVHIIMVTGMGQEFDREKGIKSGCNFYITKPFSTEELRSKAREILGL